MQTFGINSVAVAPRVLRQAGRQPASTQRPARPPDCRRPMLHTRSHLHTRAYTATQEPSGPGAAGARSERVWVWAAHRDGRRGLLAAPQQLLLLLRVQGQAAAERARRAHLPHCARPPRAHPSRPPVPQTMHACTRLPTPIVPLACCSRRTVSIREHTQSAVWTAPPAPAAGAAPMSAGVPPGASAKPLARLGFGCSGGELRRRWRSSGERECAAGERRLRRAGECGRARGGGSRPRAASPLSTLRTVTGHRSLAHLTRVSMNKLACQHSGANKCAGRFPASASACKRPVSVVAVYMSATHARRHNGVHGQACRR